MVSVSAGCNYDLLLVSNIDVPRAAYEKSRTQDVAIVLQELAAQLWPSVRASMASIIDSKTYSGRVRLSELRDVRWLTRLNVGMNLGAWDAGWRWHASRRDRLTSQDHCFLFLQDEVEIQRENWLLGFVERLGKVRQELGKASSEPRPILLGETWNQRWDKPWDLLRRSALNQAPSFGSETMGMGRVDFYLSCLKRWSINAQATGGHLRTLILFSDHQSLKAINGFHLGTNKQSCIASEIALSQSVLALGGEVAQVDQSEPFRFFWHREWRKDGASKITN